MKPPFFYVLNIRFKRNVRNIARNVLKNLDFTPDFFVFCEKHNVFINKTNVFGMATPLWIFYNKFEDALDVTGGFYVKGAKSKEVM